MTRPRLFLSLILLLAALPALAAPPGLDYPETPRVEQVDLYHGVEIADPYRWLEEDVRESERVRRWVRAQNAVSGEYLEAIPQRPELLQRLEELYGDESFRAPVERGGRYFSFERDGEQDHHAVFVQESLVSAPRLLLDPNTWSEDGTVALAGLAVSPDGRHLAYGRAEAGSDWTTWRVRRVDDGADLEDEVRWSKFTQPAWTRDGEGFFYGRYPAPREGEEFQARAEAQSVYYHRLGTPQARDVLVYERPDHPGWIFLPEVTDDGRYLLLTVAESSSGNGLWVRDLAEPYALPRPLFGATESGFENDYQVIHSRGSRLWVMTDDGAPRGRVVVVDLERPQRQHWRQVVAEREAALERAGVVGNLIFATYLEDARSEVRVLTLDGEPVRTVELPGIGTVWGFDGDADDTTTFYSYLSFATPLTVYRYDVVSGESTLWRRMDVAFAPGAGPEDFVVRQVFYTSRDGTRVPMFVAHEKGLELDGSNPTLLYGYGGFAVSMGPSFSFERLAWMERGGVFALPNLRGGGEYGEAWHEAGTGVRKQNVFDDFIAAAEWLIDNGYTRPGKLAVQGASNGGLLVGAAMTQRPDLFAAAVPEVGVLDMLRFHQFTAGRFWTRDYGTPEDAEQFRALRAYSPYHNLEPGTAYPATLVMTADTDDRVVPAHSFKFAARLQEVHDGAAPVLLRVEERAGHGAGTPKSKQVEEAADRLAFLVHVLEGKGDGGIGPATLEGEDARSTDTTSEEETQR